jgi:hypothetical protein
MFLALLSNIVPNEAKSQPAVIENLRPFLSQAYPKVKVPSKEPKKTEDSAILF